MGPVVAVWKKELKSFFISPIPYIFIVLFACKTAAQFFYFTGVGNFWFRGEAVLTTYFSDFPITLAVLVPILCMRLWPDERKSGTIETLLTMPVRIHEVVLGKFLAMVSVVVLALVVTFSVPVTVAGLAIEPIDWGPIIGAYVATLLMGAAYCAVGLFTSSFTREQAVALLLSLFICIVLAMMGTPNIDLVTPKTLFFDWFNLSETLKFASFTLRFESIGRGVLDVRDMVYFLSFTAVFTTLNITAVAMRRKG